MHTMPNRRFIFLIYRHLWQSNSAGLNTIQLYWMWTKEMLINRCQEHVIKLISNKGIYGKNYSKKYKRSKCSMYFSLYNILLHDEEELGTLKVLIGTITYNE